VEALPPFARRADAVPVAARQHADDQPLGPLAVQLRVRHPGRLALAGVLRNLARHGRMALARSEVTASDGDCFPVGRLSRAVPKAFGRLWRAVLRESQPPPPDEP